MHVCTCVKQDSSTLFPCASEPARRFLFVSHAPQIRSSTHGSWMHANTNNCSVFQYLCRNFPIVDEHVREAMGETLYDLFMVSSPRKAPCTIKQNLPTTNENRQTKLRNLCLRGLSLPHRRKMHFNPFSCKAQKHPLEVESRFTPLPTAQPDASGSHETTSLCDTESRLFCRPTRTRCTRL